MSAKGSELKRVRQAEKARVRNKAFVSKINTAVKKVLSSTNKKDANEHLNHAIKTIDKVASKNIIHKNKAANKKSSLHKHINNLS